MKLVVTHEEFQAYEELIAKIGEGNAPKDAPYAAFVNGIKTTHEIGGDHIIEINPTKLVKSVKLFNAIFADKLGVIVKASKVVMELFKELIDSFKTFVSYSNVVMSEITEYWVYTETDGDYRPIYLIGNTNGIQQKLIVVNNDKDHTIGNADNSYKVYSGHNYAFDAEASENIAQLLSKYYTDPNESVHDIISKITRELEIGEKRANAEGMMDTIDELINS